MPRQLDNRHKRKNQAISPLSHLKIIESLILLLSLLIVILQ